MRWRGGRQSDNVEDRRAQRAPRLGGMGGLGGRRGASLLPVVMKLAGTKGGMVILIVGGLFLWFSGADLGSVLGGGGMGLSQGGTQAPFEESPDERELVKFVGVVLAETEDTWHELFRQHGQQYAEPRLVLFRNATQSACGTGQAAMGPFYCPADNQVYIDLSFFRDLKTKYKAPGDFAQAYVLAHEIGHHVQTLTGISARNHAARQRASEVEANRLSVRQELQADCYAGLWAHHANKARNILEQGDLAEAMAAATAIGDDRLQKAGRGYVTPDSFTHGSSEQRVRWFKTGFERGSIEACDTFKASQL